MVEYVRTVSSTLSALVLALLWNRKGDTEMSKVTTHRAKIVTAYVGETAEAAIENAYAELNKEALEKGMVIVNQTVSVICPDPSRLCYIIVCQWMTRADLELMQTRNNLMGRSGIGGMN